MGWRDFQMDTPVHYVHKETADTPLIGLNVQGSDIEKEFKHSPDRGKSFHEATKFYRKRGWVQIFSGPMNQSIYLVKNVRIQVPDSSIPRYTQKEIEGLKNLTLDELKTLHEAKVLFRGTILS